MYNPATTVPKIINEKNPGTSFRTVEPHDDALYRDVLYVESPATVLTWSEIGPIKDTPTRTATKIVMNTAIIVFYLKIKVCSSIESIELFYLKNPMLIKTKKEKKEKEILVLFKLFLPV